MTHIGQPVRAREAERLVQGRGRFAADVMPDAAVLGVVRSPHAHAAIGSVEVPPALAAWTLADLPVVERHLPDPRLEGLEHRPRPLLADGEARYQGEGVAVVVAETAAEAADLVEAAQVDYRPLPATADPAGGEPLGTLRLGFGDVEGAFTGAAVTVRRRLALGRVTGAPMEPRAVLAEPEGDGLLVHSSTQWTYGVRDAIARALGLDGERVRVVAPDVGGAFGGKGFPYPEEVLVAAAARALGRPVRWTGTRSEDLATSCQAHGMSFEVEAAAERDGTLRGVRARFLHNAGAYTAALFAQAENLAGHMLSLYALPALEVTVDFRLTNAAPTRFIRGGARPVGNFAIERVIDAVADELGLDRVEVRRRNLVRELPHATGLRVAGQEVVVDGADFGAMLDAVTAAIGGGPGVGVACGIESSGIGRGESYGMRLAPDGELVVQLPSTPQGQAHETVYAQVAADRFGWPLERVRIEAGDSGLLGHGLQTAGSRSAIEMGNGTAAAARALREKVLADAAERLEAAPADLELSPAGIRVRGTDRAVPLLETQVTEWWKPERPRAWGPNVHAARVRVDRETGSVELLDYVIAHDAGSVINPRVVEGQVVGGLVHALGYALFEALPYREDGSLAGSTFLDYLLPSAPEVPIQPRLLHFESASGQNPEGFRGVGEAGTIPALAAIASAVESALRAQGRAHTVSVLPITPESLMEVV